MLEPWMTDARKIPDETMSYVRKIAVRAVQERHRRPEDVAEVLGISSTAVYAWLRRYDQGGFAELETKIPAGSSSEITDEIAQWIKDTILHKTPQEFGYEIALWTRDIVAQLLYENFDIELTGSAVGKHLKGLGLSYQKPWFRSQEQDPAEVSRFLDETFPRIQRLAKKMSADIGFEDEAGVGLQTYAGKTWGEAGKTPEILVSAKRGGFNIMSMITTKGILRFSIQSGRIDSVKYIGFLKQCLQGRERPLILLADRAKFHSSKAVRTFVRSNRNKIRVYFLPRYSPEMNPDEQVWNEVKDKHIGRQAIKTKPQLKAALYSVLRSLQRESEKLVSFFLLPDTRYAYESLC